MPLQSGDPSQAGMVGFALRRRERGEPRPSDVRPRWLAYSVYLEPISAEHLFLIPVAEGVAGRFRLLEMDGNDAVLLRDRSFAAMRYDAWSNVAEPTAEQLRRAPAEYPARIGGILLSSYLQAPKLDPRVGELARQLTASATNNFDRARLLQEHLRANYGYTLDMPFTGDDPIAGFLFEQRRGHCEYFASAMTIMLRLLGIPSRLVNGFLPGEYNDISGLYLVRASEAHSWVEAYFPAYGWVTFDPTPSAGTEARSSGNRLSLWLDALQSFWVDWVVNYDFARQFTLARNLDRASRRATAQSQLYITKRYRALAGWVRRWHAALKSNPAILPALIAGLGLGLMLFLSWGQLLLLWRRGASQARSRAGRASPRDATIAYERLLEFLARRGYHKLPSMSPGEFVPTVRDPALAPLVGEFTMHYERARFGGATELVPSLYRLLERLRQAQRRM